MAAKVEPFTPEQVVKMWSNDTHIGLRSLWKMIRGGEYAEPGIVAGRAIRNRGSAFWWRAFGTGSLVMATGLSAGGALVGVSNGLSPQSVMGSINTLVVAYFLVIFGVCMWKGNILERSYRQFSSLEHFGGAAARLLNTLKVSQAAAAKMKEFEFSQRAEAMLAEQEARITAAGADDTPIDHDGHTRDVFEARVLKWQRELLRQFGLPLAVSPALRDLQVRIPPKAASDPAPATT